jgi:predicted secreted Zn-dependent protease
MSVASPGRRAGSSRRFAVLPAALLAVGLAATAQARPQSHLSIKYYAITGPDDRSLDQQMSRLGPTHRGGRAYATLSADPTFNGRLEAGKICRLANFRVTADFVMTLPTLAPQVRLSAATDARWRSFLAFVRRHEERHRQIWLGCLARGEARALKIRISDCSQLDAAVEQVFKEEWTRCERLHDAWDNEQQIELKRQPLIVAASKSSRQAALSATAAQPGVKVNFRGGRATP